MSTDTSHSLGPLSRFALLQSGAFIDHTRVCRSGDYPVYGANGQIGWTDEFNYSGVEVVVGRVGSCGATVLVEGPAWITDNTIVVTPAEGVDAKYLAYALGAKDLRSLASSSIQPLLTQKILASVEVFVPSLAKQQRIVAKLDEQMAALDRAEKALAEQQATASILTAAALRQVFSGPESEYWQTLPISGLVEPNISTWNTSAHPHEQKEYIEIACIDAALKTIVSTHIVQACTAPSRARTIVHGGDVIVATTRPNLNAVAVVPPELNNQICSTGFAVLRPNELTISRWLYWSVRSPDFIRTVSDLVVGAMYPAVTDKQVKSVVIPVPPITEQQRIVAKLDKQTVSLGLVQGALTDQTAELAALRSTLLNAAFSGEI